MRFEPTRTARPGGQSQLSVRQQPFQRCAQRTEVCLHYAPNKLVVDTGVAVNQDVPKSHDARQVRNRRGSSAVNATQLTEGLADDLELAFDCAAEVIVCLVFSERLAGREPRNALGCLPRIPEQLACVRVNRALDVRPQFDPGSTG